MKKRTHRGARPRKTTHAHVLVRITKDAHHHLVDLSRSTGKTMTELASTLIKRPLDSP